MKDVGESEYEEGEHIGRDKYRENREFWMN